MRHLKHHAMHIAMCAPMLIVGAFLIATGSSLGLLIPLAGCVLMMALKMGAMGEGGGQGRPGDSR
jgi:hypothetical protein